MREIQKKSFWLRAQIVLGCVMLSALHVLVS